MPINRIENIPPLKDKTNQSEDIQRKEGGEEGAKSFSEILDEKEKELKNKNEHKEDEAETKETTNTQLSTTLNTETQKIKFREKKDTFTGMIEEILKKRDEK